MPVSILMHGVLLGLMVLLCGSAAVVAWRRAGNWLRLHRWLGFAGAGSGWIGVGIMVFEKIEHGYPHLKSPHAVGGLVVGVLLVVVPVLGFLATRGVGGLRMPHRVLARILVVLGPIVLASGVVRYLQISGAGRAAVPKAVPVGKV